MANFFSTGIQLYVVNAFNITLYCIYLFNCTLVVEHCMCIILILFIVLILVHGVICGYGVSQELNIPGPVIKVLKEWYIMVQY